MKKYFFGYLFVRIAKLLAIVVLLVGVGYCLLRYGEARLAADSVAYRSSDLLQNRLQKLAAVSRNTRQIVEDFAGKEDTLKAEEANFQRDISSNDDFEALKRQLLTIDHNRAQMKQAITARFEKLVADIEDKLRARATALEAESAQPSAGQAAAPTATPEPVSTPIPANDRNTLYHDDLVRAEIQRRTTVLEKTKQLLVVLETASENPQNRRILGDSETQVEQLETLLPSVPTPVEPSPAPITAVLTGVPTPTPKTFNAEKVANDLRRARFDVREAVLSSWALDDAFEQAAEAASLEGDKCRIANLAAKSIWLSFFGQIGLALLAAILVAFLVLVFADLIQTLLDTATNTGITAEASKIGKPDGNPI